MKCIFVGIAVLLCVGSGRIWAVEVEEKIARTFPEAPEAIRAPLVALLQAFSPGDSITITLKGQTTYLRMDDRNILRVNKEEDDDLLDLLPPIAAETPTQNQFKIAVALSLATTLNLDRFLTMPETDDRWKLVGRGDRWLSLRDPKSDSMITVTDAGAICLRNPRTLKDFSIMDSLDMELWNVVQRINQSVKRLPDEWLTSAWRGRDYYTTPEGMLLNLSIQTPAWNRLFARLQVPDMDISHARLSVSVNPFHQTSTQTQNPPITLEGQTVLPPTMERGQADITDFMIPGLLSLTAPIFSAASDFRSNYELFLQIIVPDGAPADLVAAVTTNRTYTVISSSSAAMTQIAKERPTLREALD